MSSTEDRQRRALRAFYRGRLLPAAEALRGRGVSCLEPGPDAHRETYWEPRSGRSPYLTGYSSAALAAELGRLWEAAQMAELAALSRELAELAAKLESRVSERELSPFIYEMF